MKYARILTAFLCALVFCAACASKPPEFDVPIFSEPVDITQANTEKLPLADEPDFTAAEQNPPVPESADPELSIVTEQVEITQIQQEELAQTEDILPGIPETAPADFTFAEPEIARTLPEAEVPPPPALLLVPEAELVQPAELPVPAETDVPPEITGGIWENMPSYPYIASKSQVERQPDSTPSRSVTLPLNRFLEIEYPGTGWIYLGENRTDALLAFTGRKLQGTDTLFTLRAKKSGTALLHFYKQDLLTNTAIDDYLAVTVTAEQSAAAEHVIAPKYAAVIPPHQLVKNAPAPQTATAAVPSASTDSVPKSTSPSMEAVAAAPVVTRQPTVVQTTESAPVTSTSVQQAAQSTTTAAAQAQNAAASPQIRPQSQPVSTQTQTPAISEINTDSLSPEELLKQAQDAIKTNDVKKAHRYLDAFFTKAAGQLDQGLFLRGQAYEAKTEIQNIRAALDAYQNLLRQYPSSPLWKQTDERVKYLNRFYFNVR